MGRGVVARTVLALVLAIVALGPGTPPRAVAAEDGVTGFTILGDGDTATWRAPSVWFDAPLNVDGAGPVRELWLGGDTRYMALSIGAPVGEELVVGHYPGATRLGGSAPLLKIGQTCADYEAEFTVLELVTSGDLIERVAFDFTYRCSHLTETRHGAYRYRSTIDLFGPSFEREVGSNHRVEMGTVDGGTTSPETVVTMWNDGSLPIAIEDVSFLGPDASRFAVASDDCSGTAVPPGSSCTVGITFSPPEAGVEALASLSLRGNGPRPVFGLPIQARGATKTSIAVTTPAVIEAFAGVRYAAQVTPVQDNVLQGEVTFWVDGIQVGTGQLDAEGTARSPLLSNDDQSHAVTARYVPLSWASPPVTASEHTKTVTGRRSPEITLTSPSPTDVVEGTALTFTAQMWPSVTPGWGTLRIRDGDSGAILVSTAVTAVPVTITSPPVILPVGETPIIAEFIGDPILLDKPVTRIQTVSRDAEVRVVDVSVGPTPFYPTVDGYRDALAIRGRLLEPATVSVLIYDARSTRVRTLALGQRDGAYATSWNGRKADGTAVPAGTYKVIQVLTDGLGNILRRESSVVVSWRKVQWVAASITKYGNAYASSWKGGTGSISKASSFSGGVRLSGGGSGSGYAVARWSFTLRSALAYKNLSIQVLGKSTTSSARAILAFGQDEIGSVVGPSYRWWTRTGGVTGHVIGRTVLLDVEADGPMTGAFDVSRTRVTYRYAVWS